MLNLMQIAHLHFFRDACKLADGKFLHFCKIWQISNLMTSVCISASIWQTRVSNIWFPLDEKISSFENVYHDEIDQDKNIWLIPSRIRECTHVNQLINFAEKKEKAHLALMRWRQAKSLTAAIFQPFKRNDDTDP